MIVTGEIILKNSDGYLSAELRSFRTVYLFMFMGYAVMCGFWMKLYKDHKE